MATRSLLNLTLDEIIRTKRNEGRNQSFESRNRNRGLIGRNQNWGFPKKSIISSSLSNRLSHGKAGRRGADFSNVKGDLRRNVTMQKRLGLPSEVKRTPVHSRLTMKKNTQPFRAPLALQSSSLTRKRNLRSKNSDDFQPVRITNGAIVKGLRSDQLLLQKLNQHRNLNLQNKKEQLRLRQLKSGRIAARSEKRELRPNSSSKVSLNFNRGLTVSIANEVAKRTRTSVKTRKYASPSSSSSSEEVYPVPKPARRFSAEEVKDQALPSLLRLGLERPPPPKPHRQVLDPQIQKEISALQGFNEPHSVGPGPGVKGFKMLPSRTRHSLSERFTIERNVVE